LAAIAHRAWPSSDAKTEAIQAFAAARISARRSDVIYGRHATGAAGVLKARVYSRKR
jgi:hypothetical protein